MATRTAKLKIELDGEKQYKAAIAEINRENKTLGEQMKKLSAEYKGNENSVEALSKKQELLNKSLLENQAKVAETRKQLAAWREAQERVKESLGASSEEYKTTQKKIQEYEAALAKAETAEIETQHAIDDTTKALENNGKQMVSLGDAVDQVAGKLGIKIPDGAKKALAGMEGFSAGSVAAMAGVAAAVAAVVKVVKELNDLTLEAASRADDLMTRSVTSGISTDLLQAYQYAAPYIDVSADTIVAANKKIGLSIASAAEQYAAYNEAAAKAAAQGKEYEGSLGAQAEAFQRLGVSVTDSTGQMRDSQTVMTEVLAALGGIGNQTERNSLANDLLGKSYDELAPIIQDQEKFQQLLNEAMESGYVLTEQQLEILGEVDDAHEKYTQTIEKNKNLIATQWAPASKEAYEALANLMDRAGKALVDSGLVSNFAALVQSTIGLFESGSQLIDALLEGGLVFGAVPHVLQVQHAIPNPRVEQHRSIRGNRELDEKAPRTGHSPAPILETPDARFRSLGGSHILRGMLREEGVRLLEHPRFVSVFPLNELAPHARAAITPYDIEHRLRLSRVQGQETVTHTLPPLPPIRAGSPTRRPRSSPFGDSAHRGHVASWLESSSSTLGSGCPARP